MPWDFALILVVLGVLVPWRGVRQIRWLMAQPQVSSADRLAVYASTIALQWALTPLVLWRCLARGITLEALGLAIPDPGATVTAAISIGGVFAIGQMASVRRLAALPREQQGMIGELARKLMPQNLVELLAFFALVGTVALCEELLFRGFALAVITDAVDSTLAGVVGSSIIFALGHAYQGRRGLMVTFVVGMILAATRLWTGGLLAPMVIHLVTDAIAGVAFPRLLKRAQ